MTSWISACPQNTPTLLGYTETEIRENFHAQLERAAKTLRMDVDGVLRGMAERYDGYSFALNASAKVYAPWSVLCFLESPQEGFKNYWASTGGNASVLLRFLKSGRKSDIASLRPPVRLPLSELESASDADTITDVQMLLQAGYLTIGSAAGGEVLLRFPNLEVQSAMDRLLISHVLHEKTLADIGVSNIALCLREGNPEKWVKEMNAFFISMDYRRYAVRDEASCCELVHALAHGADIRCLPELHNAFGRSDIEMFPKGVHWVMEFTYVAKGTTPADAAVAEALQTGIKQIRSRHYGEGDASPKQVCMAVVFSAEARQIVAWEEVAPKD